MILEPAAPQPDVQSLFEAFAPMVGAPQAAFGGHMQAATAKATTDAQALRDQAQERLAEALRIAQSRGLPPGVTTGPADLTSLAEQEMRTQTEAAAIDPATPEATARARESTTSPTDRNDPARARDSSTDRRTERDPQTPAPGRTNADAKQQPDAPASRNGQPTAVAPAAPPTSQQPRATGDARVVGGVSATRGATTATAANARTNLAVTQLRPLTGTAFRLASTKTAPEIPAEGKALTSQVVRGLALALRQGTGRVTLRLHPEHLGQVVVRVTVDRGQVTASLKASDPAARQLLSSSTDDLRAALEARGLSVERIDIEPAPTESAWTSSGNGTAAQQQHGGGQDARDHPHESPRHDALASVPAAAEAEMTWAVPEGARISRDAAGGVLSLEAIG